MADAGNGPKHDVKHFIEQLVTGVGLSAQMDKEFALGALSWTIIGILLTLFFSIFFGSFSVLICLKPSIEWKLLLLVCLVAAGVITFGIFAIVVQFRTIFANLINWFLNINRENGESKMAEDKKINPWGWGILFFTLWLSLISIPSLRNQPAYYLAWFYGLLSILMLVSIIKPIRDFLSRKAGNLIVTIVFYATLLSFTVAYMLGLVAVDASIRDLVAWFGFAWLAVYLGMLSSRSNIVVGIIFAVIFILVGIYYLITQQQDIGTISVVICCALGLIMFVCSLTKPKFLADIPLI